MSTVVTTLWVARDEGFLAKNNIDAELVFVAGSPVLLGALNIQRLMKLSNPTVAKVKVEDLIDDTLLRDIENSGLLDRVYSGIPEVR